MNTSYNCKNSFSKLSIYPSTYLPIMSVMSDIASEMIDFDFGLSSFVYSEHSSEYNESVNGAKKHGHSMYFKKSSLEPIRIKRTLPREIQEIVGKKHVMVPVYESSLTPNNRILNAITGLYTPYRVGTQHENHFFKVCWAVGEGGKQTPMNFFFDSPKDFEKHFITKVSDECKESWRERKLAEYRKYKQFSTKTDDELVPI